MTKKMDEFKNHNAAHKIVSGERLTPERKPVRSGDDFKRSDRTKYVFDDGSSRTLKDADKDQNYNPAWAL
jgi:hypothetical protein